MPDDMGPGQAEAGGREPERRAPMLGPTRTWEARAGGDPRPLSASLPEAARLLGGLGALDLALLRRSWASVVGEALAGHCRPVRLHGGVLVVLADDGAWASELRFHARTVVRRAQGLVPRVERLSVGVGAPKEQIW